MCTVGDIRRFPPPHNLAAKPGKLPSITNALGTTVLRFEMGEFTIIFKSAGIWLEHKSGEGMNVHPGKLEKLLKKYWEKYF